MSSIPSSLRSAVKPVFKVWLEVAKRLPAASTCIKSKLIEVESIVESIDVMAMNIRRASPAVSKIYNLEVFAYAGEQIPRTPSMNRGKPRGIKPQRLRLINGLPEE